MRRANMIDAFVVWAISIPLAAIFLVAGIPKVLGTETVGLQAAAMHGFPGWIRVLAGTAETVCGIGLLLPPIATPCALLLAAAMVPATITQYMSGEAGTWIPVTLLVLLLFVAWRRNSKQLVDGYRGFAAAPHPLLYDGILAGALGALAIAVWFFAIDLIAGRPFFTPTTLGRGLLGIIGSGPEGYSASTYVLVYTAFHFAAFMIVGLAASLVVHLARQQPSILFAFLLLFAVTEVGIIALVGLLDVASPLGRHAWLQIMVGNVLATVAMAWFFWHRHREIAEEFRHSLDWETVPDDAAVVAPPSPIGGGRDDASVPPTMR